MAQLPILTPFVRSIGTSPKGGVRTSILNPVLRYAYLSIFGLTPAMGTLAFTFPWELFRSPSRWWYTVWDLVWGLVWGLVRRLVRRFPPPAR